MLHEKGQIFHGGMKHSTEVLEYSTKVSNITRSCFDTPRRCQIFHGGVKCSTEV